MCASLTPARGARGAEVPHVCASQTPALGARGDYFPLCDDFGRRIAPNSCAWLLRLRLSRCSLHWVLEEHNSQHIQKTGHRRRHSHHLQSSCRRHCRCCCRRSLCRSSLVVVFGIVSSSSSSIVLVIDRHRRRHDDDRRIGKALGHCRSRDGHVVTQRLRRRRLSSCQSSSSS